ncbi:WhiB family transcriptional regulator [Aquihabitans sp. G128]|uniref:WhiB family transcriptional regulator n=1 Tax=Aquihabitans sp. G128 TaxID=2849779 RepID=UPI001C245A98|nr:WhiB family transcriptional regulator [Aquihabitans sp. G128]QXC59348.1 WhiB family transcriptional regulator [Aquihabitans sp. G128]
MSPQVDGYLDQEPVDPDEQALQVARAHGTTVAAIWSGRSTSAVRRLRQEVDGYDRGPGRPSLAEMAAMGVRWECPCPRCAEHRSQEATRSAFRHNATRVKVSLVDVTGWRDRAACLGLTPDPWFPFETSHEAYADARTICQACTVASDCLRFALANRILDGMFGGLTPPERRRFTIALVPQAAAS